MTPMQTTQPNIGVVIERLDRLGNLLEDLSNKIDCLSKEQSNFMVVYTRAHVEMQAEINKVNEKAIDAHRRIDKLAAGAWAIAIPILLGALAFLWGIITHTITIGAVK